AGAAGPEPLVPSPYPLAPSPMSTRRDFLKKTSAGIAAAALVTGAKPSPSTLVAADTPANIKELLLEALHAARDAGATYADARIGQYRRQFVGTRERQVTNVSDSESLGIGVRAIVGGSWGFAASSTLTKEGVQAVARDAARIARA